MLRENRELSTTRGLVPGSVHAKVPHSLEPYHHLHSVVGGAKKHEEGTALINTLA